MNNSCILATLSRDYYIKHTCNGRKKNNPILPTEEKKIAPILPPGRVAAASVICIGCLRTLPQHSWHASSIGGVLKGGPGRSLSHVCPGPCGSFQLPSSPVIDRTSQNLLFIELEQVVPKRVWVYRWNVRN